MNPKILKLGIILMSLPYPFGDVVRKIGFEYFVYRNSDE